MTNVAFVALACGLIIGLGAIGACIGIAIMGGGGGAGRRRGATRSWAGT